MRRLGGWRPTSRTGVTPPTVPDPKLSTETSSITLWSILTQPESLALVREITSESGTWDTVQSMDSGVSVRRIMSIQYATRCVTTLSTAGREPKPTSGLPSQVDKRHYRYPTLLWEMLPITKGSSMMETRLG